MYLLILKYIQLIIKKIKIHTALTEGGRSDVDIATPTKENVLFPNKAIGTAIPIRNASTIPTHKQPTSVLKKIKFKDKLLNLVIVFRF